MIMSDQETKIAMRPCEGAPRDIVPLMSKAFTKEPEGGDVYDDLPDRPI